MLPPQCRALTLRLCQLWCVTTAWVTGCSSEGEPEVWGESDASLTLSDQQDELGNQTLKRRDRSPYILIQRIENEGRSWKLDLSNWWSSSAGPGSVCISTMFAHFCLQMSTELMVVEARRGLQSHTHVHSSSCAGSFFFPPVLAHIGSFSAFRVNAADLSVSLRSTPYVTNGTFLEVGCFNCLYESAFTVWVFRELFNFACKAQTLTAFKKSLLLGLSRKQYSQSTFIIFCQCVWLIFINSWNA